MIVEFQIAERLIKEWKRHQNLIIACDFDDTIREWSIEADYESRIEILKEAQKIGATIIIWTAALPSRYDSIKEYCKFKGLEIYSINQNLEGLTYGNHGKIYANIFLDDRAGVSQSFEMLKYAINKMKK